MYFAVLFLTVFHCLTKQQYNAQMTQFIKKIALILFGSADYGFVVFGEEARKILSDNVLAEQLVHAIDKDKHGDHSNTIIVNDKPRKLVRLGERQL